MSATPTAPPETYSPPNTIFGIAAGRVVTVLSPAIATIAGAIAAWLFTHFPGLHVFGSQADTAKIIIEGLIWLVTAGITYAIHHKWLDGLSKWERGVTSDVPGDHSIVMPMMPPDGELLPGDYFDGSGEPDDPEVADIPDHEDDNLAEGEGRGMPLGFDKPKE